MTNWKVKVFSTTLAIGLLLPTQQLLMNQTAKADSSSPALTPNEQTLLQVFDLFRDQHWTKMDEDRLLIGAVSGMLSTLNDPYTDYFTPDEYQQFINMINQTYAGVGIRLAQAEDLSFVADEVFPKSPAEASGMKSGDRILSVDGHDTKNQSISTVSGWLRGKEGTSVVLKIQRASEQFTVVVTRQAIQLPSVTSETLDATTGYIRILSFSETAGSEFDQALSDLQQKGIKSLVLDLRGNGGGVVDSALHIADRFLKQGLIVEMKQNTDDQKVYADSEGVDLSLVVLVDHGSASASEILAGALQSNHRAKLIGQQSYGKGVFQQGMQLKNGSVLKLTIGQYYFADGSSPQGVGLTPDLSIKTPTLQLPAALETIHVDQPKKITFDLQHGTSSVNDQETVGPKPILQSNTTYVPLRFVMEALGTEIKWNGDTSSVSFAYKGNDVSIGMDTGKITDNGQNANLNLPYQIINDTSYISIDFLRSLSAGLQITLDSSQIQIVDK